MKAAVLYGDEDIRYEEYPEPEIQPGMVKIRVMACGICASDIPRVLDHKARFYPIVLGHEFSGYITEVADDVKTFNPGDHVAGVPLVPCLECEECKAGLYSLCKNYSFIGSRQQGAFADYIVVPEINAVKIDDAVPYDQAALFEPSTVALHALKRAGYEAGGTVAVVGGGTIGTFAIQWAKIIGAKKIVAYGRDKKHLELSKRLGADSVISTLDEDFKKQTENETEGKGYDWVIETAGSETTIKLCYELVASRGTVCLIGTPHGSISFSESEWEQINRKEMFVTGSWMSGSAPYPGDEWTMTAEAFRDGRLKFDPEVFYARFEMKDAGEAFSLFKEKSKVKGRILLYNCEEK